MSLPKDQQSPYPGGDTTSPAAPTDRDRITQRLPRTKYGDADADADGTWQGQYSPKQILDYCQRDVEATERLLTAMLPTITSLPQAVLRGRYTKAVAAMEWTGTPIDTNMLAILREHWVDIQGHLIAAIDSSYGVFEGLSFVENRFAAWLGRTGIPWTRLQSGRLDLDDKRTFRHMAKMYPAVSPLRELRHALAEMRLNDLAAGSDGRNRTSLWPFGTRTGRNTPGNSEFIFGPSVWLRALIKPPRGHAIAYCDWAQQEFGIAAALSQDLAMQAAYRSGDPYLAFGKQAGAIPADATKKTHGPQRELYKVCVLATQ
jgi:DNA polymerase I